jgi:lipopolysaccharide export system ATP-binding protein
MSGPSLQVRDLAVSFRGRSVLEGVEMEVRPGEVVGLIGPNGAGKTTAFRAVLGLLVPHRGAVSFGRPLDGLPLHRRARLGLGYLPQGPSVFRGLSARDNLLVLLEALHRPEPRRRAERLLERFGLVELAEQRASTLSGGERRRLEFARALCSDPRVLLVDEPFSGVDPLAAAEISRAIGELARDGVGVLLTDHTVREALSTCQRLELLLEGRIAESGTPDELRSSRLARDRYLGPAAG